MVFLRCKTQFSFLASWRCLMNRLLIALGVGILLSPWCGRGLRSAEPFEFSKERDWEFHGQGKFRGSLVKIEAGKAFIRLNDGLVREFWPGRAEGITGSFLQRAMCRLPTEPARPTIKPGAGPLLQLSADKLPTGPLMRWPNGGRLGGTLVAMNQPPQVGTVQGRPAVILAHAPWLMPLEFETMVSDFIWPEAAAAGPLTVAAWLCNTGAVVDRETFLCWGEKDCGELDTPDFSYGCYDALQWYNERVSFPRARFPQLNQWHHLVYVVDASEGDKNKFEVRIYVDGELVTSKSVRRPVAKLLKDNLVFLGCAWEAWWGHAWATRPARPFTGAIHELQVYDRALSAEEVRKLRGGAVANLPQRAAADLQPVPANGTREVLPNQEKLAWTPHPEANAQTLYFGKDRDAVEKGKATSIKLKAFAEEVFLPIDLKLDKLECGTTYFWRVEPTLDGKRTAGGEMWSFTTAAVDLEFDGPVSEPFPKAIAQDGFYSRYLDADGYPIISPPGNHDIHQRAARHALRKLLDKRPNLLAALQSQNAATHLASQEHRGWGWSQFTCSSYGAGEAILREGAILLHETGHQFHMQGGEALEVNFRQRLSEIFNDSWRERRWIGDYGGNNMWENVAVCASWWVNDMTQDEGDVRPRELLRQSDPRIYHFLADYWPGDTIIDLRANDGLVMDAQGRISAWHNQGGIEYFRPNAGWRRYRRSVGRFTPTIDRPAQQSVGGVTAIAFDGTSEMAWDHSTWDSLDGNRSWSVDAWVYVAAPAAGESSVVEWAVPGAEGAKLLCGSSDMAYRLPGGVAGNWKAKLATGRWQHRVWVFTGGGATDGPGDLRLYVDGQLDNVQRVKLNLPRAAKLTVAPHFTGALAQLRVYNYDLHPLQIRELWEREKSAYVPHTLTTAGRLFVDFDARQLKAPADRDAQPFYPASLERAWLRSWANRGTLGGKLHNDAHDTSSRPHVGSIGGATAIHLDGHSRLISSFADLALDAGTIELWVYPEAGTENGTLLQWAGWAVPAQGLRVGAWQHLAIVLQQGTATAYLNGARSDLLVKRSGQRDGLPRLVLGTSGNGQTWSPGFVGYVAELRIHEGKLSAEQILKNGAAGYVRLPSLLEDAKNDQIVAARNPTLQWNPGLASSGGQGDLYFGTRAAEVATADRQADVYQGIKRSGEFKPKLQPGTDYYWRVDPVDAQGQPRLRGSLWNFHTTEGLLIDLAAENLPPGPVRQWTNRGSGGGAFTPAAERDLWRPQVARIEGRVGVDFSGRKSLVANFPTPASLLGNGSFTVAIVGYCRDTRGLEREQTMISWGRRSGERVEFGWGSDAKKGAFQANKFECGYQGPHANPDKWKYNAPLMIDWRPIAFTYDGDKHKLRIYVDGLLNREETVEFAIKPSEMITLGGVRTGRGIDAQFNGALSDVAIADQVLGEAEILKWARGQLVRDWLVKLNARDLSDGPLDVWRNQGTLRGEFVLESETVHPPLAETVAGRSAVTFDSQGALQADVLTPTALTGNHPFTVEMWLFNPKFGESETVFALAPNVAMPAHWHDTNTCAANFNFGNGKESGNSLRPGAFATGQNSRNVGWKETLPVAGRWQHVAWTYSGGYPGTMQVYLDGNLAQERTLFNLHTLAGYPMFLGSGWNTARGLTNPFTGSVSSVRVYSYVRAPQEIKEAAKL